MLLDEFKPNHCIDCDLYKNCINPDMKPSGSIDASLYILGEYPFAKDDLMNKPLMGESGRLLKILLEYYKIDLSEVRYYNAVNCRPKDSEVPSDLQINSCRSKVLNDIKKTQPKVIVAMGNAALKSLFGKAEPGILGWRGLVVPFHELNCWVLPIFNPEKVVKDGLPENESRWTKDTNYTDTLKVFRDDLSIIPDLLKTPLPVNKPYYIKKLLKFDEVIAFFRMAEKEKFFTFDFETLGLKPYTKACILSCAFTFDGETAYSLPISYYEYKGTSKYWNSFQEETIIKELTNLLNNKNIKKQIHNLIFEKEWSHALLNIDLDNLEDSMLQHYILYNREKTNNLDFIAFAEFGVRWKVIPQSIMENLTKLPLNDLLEYNGQDVIWEYRLFKIQEKQLEKDKVLNEQYKEIIETAKTIAKIQFDGAVTNESSRENLIKVFQTERISIEKQLMSLDSVKSFFNNNGRNPSLRSPKDISTILFYIEQLEPSKKTKKGNKSIDKEVLTKYMERGSLFCEYLLKFREYAGGESKLLKAYTDCVFPDNKYHTNFYFVVTGRLNSNNINLQNLDKRKHPEIRQLICAPPGHVLLIYDFSQLEARILAALSNDRNFIEIIKNGYDIHLAKAIEIFGKEVIEKANKKQVKLYRFIAKNSFVFASFYGSKAKAIANRLGISEEFAQRLLDKLWSDFPAIKGWQDEQLKFYKKKGYIIIPPGRRRYAPLTTNQILNTPVQGGSASIVGRCTNILSKRAYRIVLNCHDELVFCVKEKDIKYADEEITEVMTAKHFDFMRDVPLEIEGTIGEDWYNTIPIKEVLG